MAASEKNSVVEMRLLRGYWRGNPPKKLTKGTVAEFPKEEAAGLLDAGIAEFATNPLRDEGELTD